MESKQENVFQISQKQYDGYKKDMFDEKDFTDVTLATNDNKEVEVHRVVLSSQSKFFKRILNTNSKREILIYLTNICFDELQTLLEYMYLGQTEIKEQQMKNFKNLFL